MKTLSNITKHHLLRAMTVFCIATTLIQSNLAQELAPPAAEDPTPKRALPYRGIVGSIDEKKQSFTLKNKSNKEVRHFRIDKKTRFESAGKTMTFKDLKPNMAVRGSCTKTGDRQYIARLVRWDIKKSPTQQSESK